jgi:hypothetical protein
MVQFDGYLCKSELETGIEIYTLTFQQNLYQLYIKFQFPPHICVNYKDRLVNAIQGKSHCLPRESYGTYKHTTWHNAKFRNVTVGDTLVDTGLQTVRTNTEILGSNCGEC